MTDSESEGPSCSSSASSGGRQCCKHDESKGRGRREWSLSPSEK